VELLHYWAEKVDLTVDLTKGGDPFLLNNPLDPGCLLNNRQVAALSVASGKPGEALASGVSTSWSLSGYYSKTLGLQELGAFPMLNAFTKVIAQA